MVSPSPNSSPSLACSCTSTPSGPCFEMASSSVFIVSVIVTNSASCSSISSTLVCSCIDRLFSSIVFIVSNKACFSFNKLIAFTFCSVVKFLGSSLALYTLVSKKFFCILSESSFVISPVSTLLFNSAVNISSALLVSAKSNCNSVMSCVSNTPTISEYSDFLILFFIFHFATPSLAYFVACIAVIGAP